MFHFSITSIFFWLLESNCGNETCKDVRCITGSLLKREIFLDSKLWRKGINLKWSIVSFVGSNLVVISLIKNSLWDHKNFNVQFLGREENYFMPTVMKLCPRWVFFLLLLCQQKVSIQQATKFEDPEGFGLICEEQNYKSRSFVRFMICDNKNSGDNFSDAPYNSAKCKFIVDNCGENMECADDGKCRCVEGYTSGSDGTCTDIDECMIGLHWWVINMTHTVWVI